MMEVNLTLFPSFVIFPPKLASSLICPFCGLKITSVVEMTIAG